MPIEPMNPYAAPTSLPGPPVPTSDNDLADRGARFGAAFLDGLLIGAITLPVQLLTGFFFRSQTQDATTVEQLLMILFNVLVILLLNGYLLFKRGQTIGKMALGIQIVDYRTGRLLPPLRVYVYRYLWLTPLGILAAVIPGLVDDLILNVVVLVDIIMIFGRERRCLHDYIAGSKVVKYQPEREFVAG